MPALSIETAAIIFVALLIGAITKGVTGFGLPVVAVPLLSGILGVERAVVIMVIPTMVSNAWLLWAYRGAAVGAWRHLPGFLAVAAVGTVAGTSLLAALSGRTLALILAAWLGAYLLTQVFRSGLGVPQRWRRPLSWPVGFAAGLAQGSMGVPGPIVATWFHALRLEPTVYVFCVCTVFCAGSLVQTASLSGFGLWTGERIAEGLLALIPTVIGTPIGIALGRMMDARVFNWCLLGLLAAVEVRLVWQGLA